MSRRSSALVLFLAASCSAPKTPPARGAFVAQLEKQSTAIHPLVSSAFVHRFLDATRALPDKSEDWLEGIGGSPLDYARPLDIAAQRGARFERVFDFGYGAIGHLCLMSTAGTAHVTAVDVRSKLIAMYRERCPGDITLLDGFYPTDAKIRAAVGGGYDFVISKNTLKKGYIHPDKPVPDDKLIHLGVDDATFLKAFYDALRPNGTMLVYNIYAPIPDDQPFKPMSDGRSPFPRTAWEAAGFSVGAFDEDDTAAARELLARTADPEDVSDFGALRAIYTLATRPPSN